VHVLPDWATWLKLTHDDFVEMNDVKCLIIKLSNLEQASHNIASLKQRLKGLRECIESSMHAHGDSHEFSKLRIPRCL